MTDLTIRQLQERARAWHERHFPEYDPTRSVLKAAEEVGELCRARERYLAYLNGEDNHFDDEEERNAIGDVLIPLAVLCARMNYDMNDIVESVLDEIENRSHERIVGGRKA